MEMNAADVGCCAASQMLHREDEEPVSGEGDSGYAVLDRYLRPSSYYVFQIPVQKLL